MATPPAALWRPLHHLFCKVKIRKFLGKFRHRKSANFLDVPVRKYEKCYICGRSSNLKKSYLSLQICRFAICRTCIFGQPTFEYYTTYPAAAGINSGLLLILIFPCSRSRCKPPLQASVTNKSWTPARLSPLSKLIKKLITVNPLAFSLCGVYSSTVAVQTSSDTFTDRTAWDQ